MMIDKLENLIEEYKKEAEIDSFAIRDLLTDLLHIANDKDIDLKERFESAEEVYAEECFERDRAKTND